MLHRFDPFHQFISKVIQIWIIFTFLPHLFYFDTFFGATNLLVGSQMLEHPLSMEFFLYKLNLPWLNLVCLLLLLSLSLIQLKKSLHISVYMVQLFLLYNLEIFLHAAITSGWSVLHNLIVLLIISHLLHRLSSRKIKVDQFFILFVRWQVVLIYLMGAFSKLKGTQWFFGDALKVAVHNPKFSLWISFYDMFPDFLLSTISGSVLFYQLTFVATLFSRKLNRIYVWLGMLLHLMIFLSFGLSHFFIGMVAALSSFLVRPDIPLFKITPQMELDNTTSTN